MRLHRFLNGAAVILLVCTCLAGAWYLNEKKGKVDGEPPRIQIVDDVIRCSIEADNKELIEGVTASDNIDGDISDQIIISGIQLKGITPENEKEFEITYVVFDSSNNMATESRTLYYTDYYSPRFQLNSPMIFDSPNEVKPLDYIKAEDCIDGNISGQISLEMERPSSFGTFECIAKVTNSLGDSASLPLMYQVLDSSSEEEQMRPRISLTDYIIYLRQGEPIQPSDYLSSITIDRTTYALIDADKVEITEDTTSSGYGYTTPTRGNFMLKDVINVSSDVNVDEPGTYYVRYSFRHPTEGTLGTAELMVIVE